MDLSRKAHEEALARLSPEALSMIKLHEEMLDELNNRVGGVLRGVRAPEGSEWGNSPSEG